MPGYKLNIQKSEAMILGDPYSLTVKKMFNWEQKIIKYLVIPKKLELLFKLNSGNLELQLQVPLVIGSGLALPDLKNYYLSALVQSIISWMQENSTVK